VTQRRVHPPLRSRMGHLDGDAPSHHCWKSAREETCLACEYAQSMGIDQLTQLWGQNNLPERCARKTNPRIPLLNHREKNPIQVCPPLTLAESQLLDLRLKLCQPLANLMRTYYVFPTISHGRKKRQCNLSLPDWDGSRKRLLWRDPNLQSFGQELNALPHALIVLKEWVLGTNGPRIKVKAVRNGEW